MAKLELRRPDRVVIETNPDSRKTLCTVEVVSDGTLHIYEIKGSIKARQYPSKDGA